MVWIVISNGKVSEVFNTEAAARHHAKQLNRKWSITEVICKEVLNI